MVHYTWSLHLRSGNESNASIGYARQDVQEKYVTFIIWYAFRYTNSYIGYR